MTPPAEWQKSSFSGGGEGNDCVEIARTHPRIGIRDSKAPAGAVLRVPAGAFGVFLAAVKRGDLGGDPTGPRGDLQAEGPGPRRRSRWGQCSDHRARSPAAGAYGRVRRRASGRKRTRVPVVPSAGTGSRPVTGTPCS
ncbi:DUF397 domain-containing protein [Streptomyces sp. NPDC003374]